MKFTNPAGYAADIAQVGLEATGHKEAGQVVGLWGNIGTAAVAGGVIAGPPGAILGACLGCGTWIIGEAVGLTVENKLL